ncbi:hypothetical protein DFJ74DRAFT_655693 [Hyaloraphidium curvatum]|nr:hypothetical protein DFJ74DRAFT_655693 [Hyaloraphidium curvatum]
MRVSSLIARLGAALLVALSAALPLKAAPLPDTAAPLHVLEERQTAPAALTQLLQRFDNIQAMIESGNQQNQQNMAIIVNNHRELLSKLDARSSTGPPTEAQVQNFAEFLDEEGEEDESS